MIVDDGEQGDGRTSVEGIEYFREMLDARKCGLRIGAMKDDDFGVWKCTLVTNGGQIFKGTVDLIQGMWKQIVSFHPR